VLYPGIDCARYDAGPVASSHAVDDARETVLLSVNRYDPSKNLPLAIEALARLRERVPSEVFGAVRLVMAGGYDERRREQRDTLHGLERMARDRGVAEHVVFLRSFSEAERLALLGRCRCVVYTPTDEHFGFVPLEAMAARRPVVAVASGGPLETIVHARTGLLCAPAPEAFADALARIVMHPEDARRMGEAGRRHVAENFSLAAFGARLEAIVEDLLAPAPSAR
jgi:alpha-1,3/alpha-1,6-mannosyltransferase